MNENFYLLPLVWLVSTLIISGWLFAEEQALFPEVAKEFRRKDLGQALVDGALCGLLGPLGVLIAWALTGFAEHGWKLTLKG